MSEVLSTRDVAARLHLSPRQVQRLVAHGDLRQPVRGVLDADSVDRYEATTRGARRRPWSPETAWAAVALLSGVTPTSLQGSQLSRLRGRLRAISAEDLVERARARAEVTRWLAHRSTVPRLRPDVITPARALGLAAVPDTGVDGYVPVDRVAGLVTAHGLVDDLGRGQVTLRATAEHPGLVRDLAERGVLAALDLATSLDPRERRVATDALQVVLDRYRDG
jgi:hypothetical protein